MRMPLSVNLREYLAKCAQGCNHKYALPIPKLVLDENDNIVSIDNADIVKVLIVPDLKDEKGSIRKRFRLAMDVFTGKADAFYTK